MCHRAVPSVFGLGAKGFVPARQAFYNLSYILLPNPRQHTYQE